MSFGLKDTVIHRKNKLFFEAIRSFILFYISFIQACARSWKLSALLIYTFTPIILFDPLINPPSQVLSFYLIFFYRGGNRSSVSQSNLNLAWPTSSMSVLCPCHNFQILSHTWAYREQMRMSLGRIHSSSPLPLHLSSSLTYLMSALKFSSLKTGIKSINLYSSFSFFVHLSPSNLYASYLLLMKCEPVLILCRTVGYKY